MATYAELQELRSNNSLVVKAQVAVVVAAYDLIKSGTTPTAAQTAWAANVLSAPAVEASKALMFILAKNSAAPVSQILAATDATVQAHVDEVVPSLVTAFGG